MGGDQVDRGAWKNDWDAYRQKFSLLSKLLILPTLGNHELYNYSSSTSNHYSYDAKGGLKNYNSEYGSFYSAHAPQNKSGPYYSMNVAGAHIISLDTITSAVNDLVKGQGAQYNWLMNDLKSADAHKAKYIIVVSHLPITPSPCAKGMANDQKVMQGLIDRLDPLFKENKVDLVLGGHLHCYKRANRTTSATNLPYYVVAGTSGAPGSYLGYLKLSISDAQLKVEKLKTSNGINYQVSDSFTIH